LVVADDGAFALWGRRSFGWVATAVIDVVLAAALLPRGPPAKPALTMEQISS
jgi:hypothetical protein